ncbi:MAG: ABC transporter ATP-binding protein [Collinsella sp.]
MYGTGDTAVTALNDVSFTVEAAEFIAIIGSSGSGKSTLMHPHGRCRPPHIGHRQTAGAGHLRPQRRAARRVPPPRSGPHLPVLQPHPRPQRGGEHDPAGPDGRTLRQRAAPIGPRAGAGPHGREHCLPNQLSGGQQQRVAIGRALMNAPSVVLADEPTGNLDSKNSAEIMSLLRASNKKFKQTLIVITHDEDVALMADRVIAIEDGRIVRDERRGLRWPRTPHRHARRRKRRTGRPPRRACSTLRRTLPQAQSLAHHRVHHRRRALLRAHHRDLHERGHALRRACSRPRS